MEIKPPAHRFRGKATDTHWGKFNYSVTNTQKETLDGLVYLFSWMPRAIGNSELWRYGFYSQNANDGTVTIGIHHQSVTVDRNGRVSSNERR